MGRLTTHVLNTSSGTPARDMTLRLYQYSEGKRTLLKETKTNHDGRCDSPLLEGSAFHSGTYELEFDVAAYFSTQNNTLPKIPFLSVVPIRFSIAEESSHYHVPLLVSPWSYSTYRGS